MSTNNFDLVLEVADACKQALKLSSSTEYEQYMAVYIRGLTRFNFGLAVKRLAKDGSWRLRIDANGLVSKDPTLEEHLATLSDSTEFVRSNSKRVQYDFITSDITTLVEAAESLTQFVEENDLGSAKNVESRVGVSFNGTQFDRLKERGATMSPMFCKLVCDASGMNMFNIQAEYYVDAGEIDGVEFNEAGQVVSIYECQSGIHKGLPLDSLHREKALGSYLYDPEVIPTVRKVVILAGAYNDEDLGVLKERAYELSRRENPIELICLVTTRNENRIGVERVNFG